MPSLLKRFLPASCLVLVIGVALAWQVVFLLIARDPLKYRVFMLPAVLEKTAFSIAVFVLFARQRISIDMLLAGSFDFVLGVLFKVPQTSAAPLLNTARVKTGKFCRLFAPVSVSS